MTDYKAKIGFSENRFTVRNVEEDSLKSIPAETLEGIMVTNAASISVKTIEECLRRDIPITFASNRGYYLGCIKSTIYNNTHRQRMQCALYDTDFSLQIAGQIWSAKVHNQLVVLRRYAKSKGTDLSGHLQMLKHCRKKIENSDTISKMMGYEGLAARYYFDGLSICTDEKFRFKGRSKKPPKDEFNVMLSVGYTMLFSEIYRQIEIKGLNPYFGFMHRDDNGHAALVSDIMEEWRPVLVDSTVMAMVNGHEIYADDFLKEYGKSSGIIMTKDGLRKYIDRFRKKLESSCQYIPGVNYSTTYLNAFNIQISRLAKAIDTGNAKYYEAIRIR